MIKQRKDKFCVRVYNPLTGKPDWIGTFDSRTEAEHEEAKAKRERSTRKIETVASFAGRWVDDYPRPAPNTNRKRRQSTKKFVMEFGKRSLASIRRAEMRPWALTQSINQIDDLRVMFSDAIDDDLHPGPNPFGKLRLNRSRGRRDLDVISEEQFDGLLQACEEVCGEWGQLVFAAMIKFQAFMLARPAELYYVERGDIRPPYALITKAADGAGGVKNPKSNDKRRVALPKVVEEAVAVIPPRIDVPWLFYTITGKQFTKSTLNYYWRRVNAAAGLSDMEWYELKHYGAAYYTNVLGIDPADSAIQAGHRDGGRLIRTNYGHPSEELARQRILKAFEANERAAERKLRRLFP